MADARTLEFDRRLRKIAKQKNKLSKGYMMSVNHDGLVIARPRRQGINFPVRGIAMVLIAFVLFKAFVLAYLGQGGYADRLASLQAGTAAEKATAYVLAADPATIWLAQSIRAYLP